MHRCYRDDALDARPANRHFRVIGGVTMKLYFSPLACSLATRIALYEIGLAASYVEVDGKSKQTSEGRDYRSVNSLGLVPALELDDGTVLTENAAVLQYLADAYPAARLAPPSGDILAHARLRQWLSFIGTELHQGLFLPLLGRNVPPEVKTHALSRADSRLGWVSERLQGREFLLDHFTVADAFLYAVLNWCAVTPVDLAAHPTLRSYHATLAHRPSIAQAFKEERHLYLANK
jgi:glutathione S-transferase